MERKEVLESRKIIQSDWKERTDRHFGMRTGCLFCDRKELVPSTTSS